MHGATMKVELSNLLLSAVSLVFNIIIPYTQFITVSILAE